MGIYSDILEENKERGIVEYIPGRRNIWREIRNKRDYLEKIFSTEVVNKYKTENIEQQHAIDEEKYITLKYFHEKLYQIKCIEKELRNVYYELQGSTMRNLLLLYSDDTKKLYKYIKSITDSLDGRIKTNINSNEIEGINKSRKQLLKDTYNIALSYINYEHRTKEKIDEVLNDCWIMSNSVVKRRKKISKQEFREEFIKVNELIETNKTCVFCGNKIYANINICVNCLQSI